MTAAWSASSRARRSSRASSPQGSTRARRRSARSPSRRTTRSMPTRPLDEAFRFIEEHDAERVPVVDGRPTRRGRLTRGPAASARRGRGATPSADESLTALRGPGCPARPARPRTARGAAYRRSRDARARRRGARRSRSGWRSTTARSCSRPAESRKVRNLERDSHATLALHDSRAGLEVCGASIRGRGSIVRGGDAAPLSSSSTAVTSPCPALRSLPSPGSSQATTWRSSSTRVSDDLGRAGEPRQRGRCAPRARRCRS